LRHRIGDYVLFLRENRTLIQDLLGDTRHDFPGMHGGTSPEEMWVPLIVVKR
jgi:hypothetical protein